MNASVQPLAPSPADDPVARRVMEIFKAETAYGDEALDPRADLDGELGIDSVTTISILESITRALGLPPSSLPEGELKTIGAVVERARQVLAELAVAPLAPGGSPASQAPARPETMRDFYEERGRDLFAKAARFRPFFKAREAENLYWYGMPLLGPCTNRVTIHDQVADRPREYLMMASNNYLGLANHPRVIEAIRGAAASYGATNTGCRLIGGTNSLHLELERRLARFKGCEAAMVFPSGYSANLGVISGLVRRHDCVIGDEYNHMSLVDGGKLSGGAVRLYRHGDMDELREILSRCESDFEGMLIVTDGVFSMHGDVCDLPAIVRLAGRHGARVLVDDAHATGVLGATGAGTSEHFGMKGQVDLEVGTFSKALAGVGGFVCGKEEVIDYLRFYANSYVFAATIPAPITAGLIAALEVLEGEPERLAQLWRNIDRLRGRLVSLGFDVGESRSAIVPVVVGDHARALALGRAVRAHGLFCQTVVYPGVGQGQERLRLSLSCEHTPADLDQAVEILIAAAGEVGWPLGPGDDRRA